jgi:PAS domain S-box-containing protein
MTSYGDEHLAVEILKSGAIDYFRKSATAFQELPVTARRVLREWENIHARRRAEIHERDAQKRLADVLAFLPDAVFATDPEGRVIVWNQTIEKMTGVSAAEMIGKGDHEYSIPFYGERRAILVDLVLKDDPEVRKKYDYIQQDGDRITSETFATNLYGGRGAYLWGVASPLYDMAGNRTGAIEVIRDITDRRSTELDLKAARKSLDEAHRIAHIGVWNCVAKTGTVAWSEELCRIVGWDPAVPPPSFGELERFYTPEGWKNLKDAAHHSLSTGEPFRLELELIRTDGSRRWQMVTGGAEYDNGGKAIGLQGTVQDITERKNAELAVSRSEKKYRFLVENVHDIIWQTDRDAVFTYLSPAVRLVFGRSAGELIGKSLFSILTERSAAAVRERLRDRLEQYHEGKGDLSTVFEVDAVRDNGTTIWLEISSNPVYGPGGELTGFHGISRDISARRHAEEALRESEERFREIFNKANDGIELIALGPDDSPGRFIDVNEVACRMVQYTREELLEKSPFDIDTGTFSRPFDEIMKEIGAVGHATFETGHRRKDGTVLPVEINTHRITLHGTDVLLSIIRDISERRRVDEELIRQKEEAERYLDLATVMFIALDREGRIILANRRAEELLGCPRSRMLGTNWFDRFIPERAREKVRGFHARLISGETEYIGYAEESVITRSGEERLIAWHNTVIRDEDGRITATLSSGEDITSSRKAEVALRESEERYRTLVEEMPDFVIVHRRGELLFLNASITRLLGKPAETLLHTGIMDYIAPESREAIISAMEKRSLGGVIAPYIARLILPNGSTRWVEIRGAQILFGGEPASFNVLTDITEKKWAEEALYESEKKFRTVADYTYDWEYWIGKDRNFIYVSPSCERISGYLPEDFYHDKDLLRQIIVAEDRTLFDLHEESLSHREDPQHIEFRITAKDGRILWIGHICQPVFSPDGEFLGRRGSNRDITSRKEAEDALKASEVRFRSVIQNSSDIIRILDRDRKIAFESSSSERILGYPPGFFIGKDPRDLIHPADRHRVKEDFQDVLDRTNTGIPTEFRILKADGSYLWVDAIGTNLLGVPGVDGIVITIRSIQQRKLMERELRDQQIQLAAAMDLAHLVNWEFNLRTGIFTFNDRFYALYGTDTEREGGYQMPAETYVREFVHPDDVPYVTGVIGDTASITDPDFSAELEHRIIRRDGEMRYIVVRFGVVMDADGAVVMTRGANQDITDRKMMESEIRSLNTVLEQRVIQRTDELNKSLQEKELLLREIHHRVKNNLQIIISILRLQKRQITDSATLATLMDSESRVRSMALVHEKLYRSKDLEHIDIGDYLKALTQYLFTTYAVEQRRIAFSVAMSELSLDIQRAIPIGLILNELITNALKHAFPQGRKGEVRITGKKEEDRILIFIEDNGAGFPDGLDWRHTSSLGMHLVMTLIEQVRGTIDLTTGSGGSRFTLSIPLRGGKTP